MTLDLDPPAPPARPSAGLGRFTGNVGEDVSSRIELLEIPFNRFGIDPYGTSKKHVARWLRALAAAYRYYFHVRTYGIEHIPRRGRAMLVGNHSGGIAIDGAMVIASAFLEMNPPRLAQGMVEKFIHRVPLFSQWASRTGQFPGLPENAERLLQDERLLMVFPEGARGTAKLYPDRYSLVEFGTGFVRLAMKTKTPIVPFGFIGGGDAVPTIANAYKLGRLFGAPYVPITPYLVAVPLPVRLGIEYGPPIVLEGTGTEDDEVVHGHVERIKTEIGALIERGRARA